MSGERLITRVEVEHGFQQGLYSIPVFRDALNLIGLTQNMRGNLSGLYSEADTVAAVQSTSDDLQTHLRSGDAFGTVQHDRLSATYPPNDVPSTIGLSMPKESQKPFTSSPH